MDLDSSMTIDNDGDYIFNYPLGKSSSYARVIGETNRRNGRIFWTSQDSFEYVYQGILFKECVINYSTYCLDEVGDDVINPKYECQQLIYLNQSLIGDTIEIVGYYNEEIFGITRFIVK
jgi:hypothetical protein